VDAATEADVWVGIDLGTQSVRALAVSGSGEVLGAGTAALHSHRDGQRHEQDPDQWWLAVRSACAEALRGLAGRTGRRGSGWDGTSGTVLCSPTAADGRPLTAALMYDDTRGAEFTEAGQRGRRGGLGQPGLPPHAAGVGAAETTLAAARTP